ncbi:MAG: hypothetical protein M4579_005178 [Chaenotheca gracillima]|nr:MAG: hypothetical protein M4579_005178 [Chaenotheca gracillima]
MNFFLTLIGALAITTTGARAQRTCLHQQHRGDEAPDANVTITDALLPLVSSPSNGICYAGFPVLPNGSRSKSVRRSNGVLVLEATQHAQGASLGKGCVAAFESLIHVCIGHAPYWGGNATVDGIDIAIYNEAFPKPWTPASGAAPPLSPHAPATHVGGASKPTTKPPGGHVSKPVAPTTSPAFRTRTLAGVTGPPKSFSQTKTTNSNGVATILPVWFDAAGAAIILTPLIAGFALVPPPPPGLPAVVIGPDGVASADSPGDDHHQQQQTGHSEPRNSHHSPATTSRHSTRPTPSTRPSSSSRSTSSSRTSSGASSASPAATKLPYIITPREPHNSANDGVTTQLRALYGSELLVVSNPYSGLVFWAAAMTPPQVARFERNPAILSILDDREQHEALSEDDLFDEPHSRRRRGIFRPGNSTVLRSRGESVRRDDPFDHQVNAPWDLVTLSQPPAFTGELIDYVYEFQAGEASTIYNIDSGSDPTHPDYAYMTGTKRILFAPGRPGDHLAPFTHSDEVGTGTCILSKAAGRTFGVTRRANVVSVKWPYTLDGRNIPGSTPALAALNMVLEDVIRTGSKRNVLSISWAIGQNADGVPHARLFTNLLRDLLLHGVIITAAAGDEADENELVDSFPALMASKLPIIVTSAVDEGGRLIPGAQSGGLVAAFAPGAQIECAHYDTEDSIEADGTAIASPLVAGLAAYLMSVHTYDSQLFGTGGISQLPVNMMKLIMSLSYKRQGATLPVIFNGMSWLDEDGEMDPCAGFGRFGGKKFPKFPDGTFNFPGTGIDPTVSYPGYPYPAGEFPPTGAAPAAKQKRAAACSLSRPATTTKSVTMSFSPWSCAPTVACSSFSCASERFFARTWSLAAPTIDNQLSREHSPSTDAPSSVSKLIHVGPCLVYEKGDDASACGKCLQEASGTPDCVTCFPTCRRTIFDGNTRGIDCSDKTIFPPCIGTDDPKHTSISMPGICTWIGYTRKAPVTELATPECDIGTVCDVGVDNTKTCLPPPP